MTAPGRPAPIRTTDADLYDALVERGLPPDQAALHVARRKEARESFISGSAADRAEVEPSAAGSIIGGLLHGGSLGAGELVSGVAGSVSGKGFRAGAQGYRDALSDLEAANPKLAAGSEIAGSLAIPAAQVGGTLAKGVQAGIPLGVPGALRLMGRGGIAAAIPSAISGFSSGGEDPGDFGARIKQGATSAGEGAILGALLTGLSLPAVRSHVEAAADVTQRGNQRALTEQRLLNARARGARLTTRGALSRDVQPLPPEPELEAELGTKAPMRPPNPDAAQALRDFEAGKISETDLQDALDFARGKSLPSEPAPISKGPPGLRTGERATPIAGTEGRGIEVTGTRATPAPPSSPTILEMQEGRPVNHWSSNQPPSQVGTSSPETPPTQAGLAGQQTVLIREMPFKGLKGLEASTPTGSPLWQAIRAELQRRGISEASPTRGVLR